MIPLIAVLLLGITNTAYAAEEESTVKKLSDYVNGNWGWLLLVGIVCIILGFFLFPLLWVGAILVVIIILNWVLLSPMLNG